ncbi:MAG TPA: TlpA disulfide reductase family protein [Acidobacteriota bacterium]|nr:TlpA disulfide reductase family protein [Acidobacteriota bacterium]
MLKHVSPRTVSLVSTGAFLGALFLAFNFPSTGAQSWIPPELREHADLTGDFRTVEGETVSLDAFSDRVLLVNFWATWCRPCLLEMPSMARLQEEFGERGLSIVSISDEDPKTVTRFLDRHPYPFTFLIDRERILHSRFGVTVLPSSLLLDRKRRLVYPHQGFLQWDDEGIRRRIDRLLTE